jgi:hypothetical protein
MKSPLLLGTRSDPHLAMYLRMARLGPMGGPIPALGQVRGSLSARVNPACATGDSRGRCQGSPISNAGLVS